ncbi:leucine-rich repeat-containing protein 37A-like, partial [Canis lupus familiaris]|uniref:leucine-rich repeat-containing protein 37A-like n=1 Tax=Canis lupus familiaris TaxID=9615 RepID=UPI0018F73A7D
MGASPGSLNISVSLARPSAPLAWVSAPQSIMSRLCLYLLFIFTWQPSWLLGQAAPLPAWARRTSGPRRSPEPPEPPEPWSSHSSELLHESLQALTRPAEAGGGFNNLRSSAPAQMSAPPKQLTETLVPFLDTDSNGELPPETDQYLNDKPTLHERLLQVVPALGDENQAIVLPPPLKSKMKTGDEPEDHQSLEILAPPLDSQGLNQRKFFCFIPKPGQRSSSASKACQRSWKFCKPTGGPAEPSSTPEVQQEASAQPTEAPEEVEPWTPQEAPAQPPEEKVPPQEVNVPSLSQNEAQRPKLHNVTVKPVDLALTVTVTQPPQHPKKAEPAILQEQPAQPPELSLGEVEPIPTQQEHPAQPLEHHEVKVAPPGHHQVQQLNLPNITVKPAGVQVTVTPEPTTEVGPLPVQRESVTQPSVPLNVEAFATQHEAPTLPPQSPEENEHLPFQQETPTESPESPTQEKPPTQQETPVQTPGEVKPSTTQQDTLAQDSQAPEEGESPSTQEEALAQLPGTQEEKEPSPPQQEAPAELPQIPEEGEPSSIQEESQDHHAQTPEKAKPSSTQQEAPTQYPQASEEGEPSPAQEEAPTQFPQIHVKSGFPEQHPAPAENVEPYPDQQGVPEQTGDLPEETELSPSQQWSSSLPQMPVVGVEPSPVQPEHQAQPPESSTDIVAQPPVHYEVTSSRLGPGEAQHPMLPNITAKPVDLEVFITPVPTKFEHSPGQQEASAQAPVPPEQVEFSPAQSELLFQSPETLEDEFPPGQQELIVKTPDPPKEMEPTSAQQEAPVEPSEPHKEIEPSSNEYTVSAHSPGPTEDVKPPTQPEVPAQPPVPQQVPAISPEPRQEVEPSATQQESPAQSLELADKVEPLPVSQKTPSQLLQFPEKVESSPVLQEAPSLPLEPLKEVEL